MDTLLVDFLGFFIFFAGFVIGQGAVTVIDFHGLLARTSPYWTEATIRTHKITKPLIWSGMFLACIGGLIVYRNAPLAGIPLAHLILGIVLIINGCFLSFSISPYLLAKEKEGASKELLPPNIQRKIVVSFLFSFTGWWSALGLLVWYVIFIR
jgi:hypothetical protein